MGVPLRIRSLARKRSSNACCMLTAGQGKGIDVDDVCEKLNKTIKRMRATRSIATLIPRTQFITWLLRCMATHDSMGNKSSAPQRKRVERADAKERSVVTSTLWPIFDCSGGDRQSFDGIWESAAAAAQVPSRAAHDGGDDRLVAAVQTLFGREVADQAEVEAEEAAAEEEGGAPRGGSLGGEEEEEEEEEEEGEGQRAAADEGLAEAEALRREKAAAQIERMAKYPVHPVHAHDQSLHRQGVELLGDVRSERAAAAAAEARKRAQFSAASALYTSMLESVRSTCEVASGAGGSVGSGSLGEWQNEFRSEGGVLGSRQHQEREEKKRQLEQEGAME